MTMRFGKVHTKFWRADDLGGAELLRGTFADYSYDVHTHSNACLALITQGAIRIRMRKAEFVAQTGDLYAIDAEEPHAGWPIDDNGWSLRTLYVDVSRLRATISDDAGAFALTPALAGPIIRDRQLTGLFHDVHASSEAAGSPLEREERYSDFIARLFEQHTDGGQRLAQPGREDRAIRRAREFLDARLDEKVHLGDIAQAAGLPPYRLFRAFQRATGMTPHCYQRQARIRGAANLIKLGHALGDVAAASGFADQAHLTRVFRGTMGITPGAFRNAYRQVPFRLNPCRRAGCYIDSNLVDERIYS
jgi:AraC-like DNA-binding protein